MLLALLAIFTWSMGGLRRDANLTDATKSWIASTPANPHSTANSNSKAPADVKRSSPIEKLDRPPLAPISNLPNSKQLRANPILAKILKNAPIIDTRTVNMADGNRNETTIFRTSEKYPYVRVERQWSPAGELLSEQALVADHLLVRVMDSTATADTITLLTNAGLTVRHRLWTPGYLLVSGPPPTLEALDLLQAQLDAAAGEAVAFSETDQMVFATLTPNDPHFSSLWGMEANGGPDIDAPQAWDQISGAPDIVVSVIDTGVEYTHPDLAANIWVNVGEIPDNGVDDDANGLIDDVHGYDFYNDDGDPIDDHYHGTHVSGTIAAVGNNGEGVAGVAWQAQIMAIKFLSNTGSGTISGAIDSIAYSGEMGAHLSNNSWGGSGSAPFSLQIIIDLNRYPFITSAGNNGANIDQSPYLPAGIDQDHIISVAAHGQSDTLAWFSNYGAESVDVSAPGVSIRSTFTGGGYNYLSGTSMAAPHVAGVCALLLQASPNLSNAELKNILMSSVVTAEYLDGKVASGGKLNLNQALDLLSVDPPTINSSLTASAVLGNAFSYQIAGNNAPDTFDATGLPTGLSVDTDGLISGTPTVAGNFDVILSASNFAGTDTQTLSLSINHLAPVITSSLAMQSSWGAPLSYTITADNGADSFNAVGLPDGLSIHNDTGEISGQPTTSGEFVITISASNTIGSDQQTLTLTVLEPELPVITSPLVHTCEINQPFTYAITATNFPTAYSTAGLPAGLSINTDTGVISGAATEDGEFTITLSASNPGGTASATLYLEVLPQPPTITSELAISAETGEPISYQITAANFPTSFSADSLPDGLSINNSTGRIEGVVLFAGTYPVSISATNDGGTDGQLLTITIAEGPPRIVNFAPTSLDPDATLTITGVGLADASAVIFSNDSMEVHAVSFVVVSDTEISAIVPYIPMDHGDHGRITVLTPHGLATTLPPDTLEVFDAAAAYTQHTFRVHDGGIVDATGSESNFVIKSGGIVHTGNGGIFYVGAGGVLNMTHLSGSATVYYTPDAFLLDAPIVNNNSMSFITVPHIRSIVLPAALWINQTPQIFSPLSATVAVGDFFDYELLVNENTGIDISVGSLPTGLSFNSTTRRLFGYPITPGQYDIEFTLANTIGTTDATFSLNVTGEAIPVLDVARSYSMTSSLPFALQLTAANSPTSFDAVDLPDGLAVDQLSGIITGHATTSGAYPVTLSATNAAGTSTRLVNFYVNISPLSISDFTPDYASEGDTITVYGEGFMEVQRIRLINRSNTLVTLESPTIHSDTDLSFTAPALSLYDFEGTSLIVETDEWAAVSAQSDNAPGLRMFHLVEAGETLDTFNEQDTIYVKSGGIASMAISTQGTFFLEDGATLDMANQIEPRATILRSPNANIINVDGEEFVNTHALPSLRYFDIGYQLSIFNALDYWIAQNFVVGVTRENISTVDSNGDNIPDLLNYALGTGMGEAAHTRDNLPVYTPTDNLRAEYRYRRLRGPGSGNTVDGYTIGSVTYVVYWSADMAKWQTGGNLIEQIGEPVDNGDGFETVTVRAVYSLTNCPSFFQLDISPVD